MTDTEYLLLCLTLVPTQYASLVRALLYVFIRRLLLLPELHSVLLTHSPCDSLQINPSTSVSQDRTDTCSGGNKYFTRFAMTNHQPLILSIKAPSTFPPPQESAFNRLYLEYITASLSQAIFTYHPPCVPSPSSPQPSLSSPPSPPPASAVSPSQAQSPPGPASASLS